MRIDHRFSTRNRLALTICLLVLGSSLLLSACSATRSGGGGKVAASAPAAAGHGTANPAWMASFANTPVDQSKPADGDFWAIRAAYPTGRFLPSWVARAAVQHRALARGVPGGEKRYPAAGSESPLRLAASAFTSLGPQPLQTDGCQACFSFGRVAGRTNVLVGDPTRAHIAYAGSDGGGVWKTTNCCSAATTWTPVTDDPLLNGVAIGDLVLDPNDPDTIYAGTGDLRYGSWSFGSAGVLRSTDQGATWSILGGDVFDPVYPQGVNVFPQYQAIGKVRVDPANSDTLVVGAKTGVYFSYDAGSNWDGPCLPTSFTTQRHDITGLELIETAGATDVLAAVGTRGHNTTVQPDLDQNGANGIYRAAIPVSGCPASWTLLTRPDNGWPAGTGGGTPFPTNSIGRIDMAVAPSNSAVIYAQVANITTRALRAVWRSGDGGATWQERATASGITGCAGGGNQAWYDQGITVDPTDPDVLFMSTVDLVRSTNGGTTFENVTCGYAGGADDVHVDHHARAYVVGDPDRLLVGNDGGAYYTGNARATPVSAVTFDQMNNSLSTIEFYSGDITANFATSPNPGVNAGAQDNGSSVFVWTGTAPGPAEWQMTTGGDGMYARIEPMFGQRWYQESQNGNLKVSTTGPFGTYVNARPLAGGAWGGDTLSFVMPYEINKYDCPLSGCDQMIAGTNRVWETIQGAVPASSWYINSPNLTKGVLGNRSFVTQLSFGVSDGSVVIVGTNDGNVWYGFGMGQGTANSGTWQDVTGSNSVLPNRPIMDVATDPLTPTIGYASIGGFAENTPTTPGHVYRIACNADCSSFTWTDKSGDLPNIPVNSIIVNPHLPNQVFAGSDWGLYFTDDITAASPVWQRFTDGLPTVMIWDMAIDRGFTTLALFTRSRGAYVWPLPTQAPGIFADGFESGDTTLWSNSVGQ